MSLRALVIGLRGVGCETAKNLILGRPAAVSVWDNRLVEIADLGVNFYVKPEHVGKPHPELLVLNRSWFVGAFS